MVETIYFKRKWSLSDWKPSQTTGSHSCIKVHAQSKWCFWYWKQTPTAVCFSLTEHSMLQAAHTIILPQFGVTVWGVGCSLNPKKRAVPSPYIPLPATSGSTQTFGLLVAFLCIGKARYKLTPLSLKLKAEWWNITVCSASSCSVIIKEGRRRKRKKKSHACLLIPLKQ